MDEQIAKGKDGYILLKFNSLTDIDVIAKLREASCAGVTGRDDRARHLLPAARCAGPHREHHSDEHCRTFS